jgi:hypothetical protein
MTTFNKIAIQDYNEGLIIIDKKFDNGDLDMEDYEIELQSLLLNKLQDYFGGKYTELNDNSLRISNHKQGNVYNSSTDYSFVVCRPNTQSGIDYTIQYHEDIEEAINYVITTLNKH